MKITGNKALTILAGLILLEVLAGIFIPRWLEHPNEKAAKATLWKIYEAQNTYYQHYGVYSNLDYLKQEELISQELATCFKKESLFLMLPSAPDMSWHGEGKCYSAVKEGYYFILFTADSEWYAFAEQNKTKGGRWHWYRNDNKGVLETVYEGDSSGHWWDSLFGNRK